MSFPFLLSLSKTNISLIGVRLDHPFSRRDIQLLVNTACLIEQMTVFNRHLAE